jgi:hypothetical protein
MPGVRLGSVMQERLFGAISLYERYLDETRRTLSADIEALPTLSSDKLPMAGHEELDSIAYLDNGKIREKREARYGERMGNIASAMNTLSTLKARLINVPAIFRMKMSILNKGATDGLVRHRGSIRYRGNYHTIKRTAPPSSDLSMTFVPVYQTNKVGENSITAINRKS